MYSPVLLFTAAQKWTPIKVDDYLKLTRMADWTGRKVRTPPLQRLPDACPGIVSKPCYTLHCIDVATCAAATSKKARDHGAVYVRVERRERWKSTRTSRRKGRPLAPQARSPNPFTTAQELAEQQRLVRATKVLLQYWYFYPYDEWLAPVLGGQFKQRHEADWEAITVGLDDDGRCTSPIPRTAAARGRRGTTSASPTTSSRGCIRSSRSPRARRRTTARPRRAARPTGRSARACRPRR